MKHTTKIEIFGRTYMIKGDADADYALRLAEYVDKKMREVSEKTPTVSSLKVAILAALNIADELFKLRENTQISDQAIEKRTTELLTLLDKEL